MDKRPSHSHGGFQLFDHRGSYHADYDPEVDLDIDENTLLGDENEIMEVLNMLGQQRSLRLTKEQAQQLRDSKLKTFEKAFTQWNNAMVEAERENDDEEEDIADFAENPRLIKAWKTRRPWVNWTLSIGFHFIVITNFAFCFWESFSNMAESSMYDLMYLKNQFQCLNAVPNQRSLGHVASILHALTCITVLHAKSRKTANLCWAFLIGTTIHASYKLYEIFYEKRFTFDDKIRGLDSQWKSYIQLVGISLFQFLAILLIIQRYYDLTENFQGRAREVSTQTYEGRQLNDKISYKNLSSFEQRKNVLRSCSALQIYNTVQTLQGLKKRLKKGQTLDQDIFNKEVKEAVATLKDVEHIKGMEMLKELKRRQYKKAQEELFDEIQEELQEEQQYKEQEHHHQHQQHINLAEYFEEEDFSTIGDEPVKHGHHGHHRHPVKKKKKRSSAISNSSTYGLKLNP